jgi:Neuraminidase (sialidase)
MDPLIYAQEVGRTRPDCVVYRPHAERGPDAENQQIIGLVTAGGHWLLTWTQATHENNPDQHVVVSRSEDRGATWRAPQGSTARRRHSRPGRSGANTRRAGRSSSRRRRSGGSTFATTRTSA